MAATSSAPPRHDDLDNYDVDDFSDDPFGSPPRDDAATKKRKEADAGLGLDEEVSVQKRARVPNVKLDEERLLGPRGIPRLRRKARDLKFKGKGHEFSDAQRLLSFYQLWLDDLFPKAKFLDALAMVEKAGHKKALTIARNDIINEGKPKDSAGGDEEDEFADLFPESTDAAPTTTSTAPAAPKTPPRNDDVPDDEDLYDATPRRPVSLPIRNDAVPDDEDDLDALIAEAETHDQTSRPRPEPEDDDLDALIAEAETHDQPKPQPPNAEPEDDDLDALMAEAEAHDQAPVSEPVREERRGEGDFADDEAAMQEMAGLW